MITQICGECSRLEQLDLSDTDITDKAIQRLKEMSTLRAVFIQNSKISPKGLRELRDHLPHCHIAYSAAKVD